jgi:uncharacterized membrane protein (DUF441 family)
LGTKLEKRYFSRLFSLSFCGKENIFKSFLSVKSLLAIAIGVLVAWLGGRGVKLMSNQPDVVAGLLVGTVAGVALLRGVPVGPLIAAGLLTLIIGTGQP